VTLVPQPVGTLRNAITDAEGRCEIGALPAGDYRLEAVLAGFGSREALVSPLVRPGPSNSRSTSRRSPKPSL
jgi:hypothetical protein